jgi:S-adenosylmethionine decarboxylase
MQGGIEWLVDATGCPAETLRDVERLAAVCSRAVAEIKLHVVGQPVWQTFPDPGGATGLYLLTESHLACHSFPESGTVTFNLYCCRPRRRWSWERVLVEMLGATEVRVRHLRRGRDALRHHAPRLPREAVFPAVSGSQENSR